MQWALNKVFGRLQGELSVVSKRKHKRETQDDKKSIKESVRQQFESMEKYYRA